MVVETVPDSPEDVFVSFANLSLKLDGQNDVESMVEEVKKRSRLTCLNISGNTLGIDAAKSLGDALKGASCLKRCIFSDLFTGRLKNEIAPALTHLSAGIMISGASLVELDLSDNAFGPNGVVGVVDLLSSPACFSLQVLRMNNQGLGHEGCRYLAQALQKGRQACNKRGLLLKVFSGGRNRLENVGAQLLADVFADMGSLEEISLHQNGIGIHGIAGIHSLVKIVKHNRNLRLINFSDNNITSRGCTALANVLKSLAFLEELYLGDCILKSAGAKALATALGDPDVTPALRVLHLTGNEITCNAAISLIISLGTKSELKELDLNANEFGRAGIQTVLSTLNSVGLLHVLPKDVHTPRQEKSVDGESFTHAFDDDQGSGEEDDSESDGHSHDNESESCNEDYGNEVYETEDSGENDGETDQSTFNTVEEELADKFSFRLLEAALDRGPCSPTSIKNESANRNGPFGAGLFSGLGVDSTDAASMRSRKWLQTPLFDCSSTRPQTGTLFLPSLLSTSDTNQDTLIDQESQLKQCLSDSSQDVDIERLIGRIKDHYSPNLFIPSKLRSLMSPEVPEHVVRLALRIGRSLPYPDSTQSSPLSQVAVNLLASALIPESQTKTDNPNALNFAGRAANCLLVHLGAIKAERGSIDYVHLKSLSPSEQQHCQLNYLHLIHRLFESYRDDLSPEVRNSLTLLLSEQRAKECTVNSQRSTESSRIRDDLISLLQNQLTSLHI